MKAVELTTTEFVVDAHVHLYPFMRISTTLDFCLRNFHHVADSRRSGERRADEVRLLLFIADPPGIDGYERLAALGGHNPAVGNQTWTRIGEDSRSVSIRHSSGKHLTAVRGQQLVTEEGLEVLAIGCRGALDSNLPLRRCVDRVSSMGGWSIIAWGAGKWLGRRGRLVSEMIDSECGRGDILLADSGSRPKLWSRVPQFDFANEKGMRILAGTDPLPLPGEERRIGSFCSRHFCQIKEDESVVDGIMRSVGESGQGIEIIGDRSPFQSFALSQIRLRLRH